MSFNPMDRMWERVEIARQDSDTALFLHLLYAGEMLTKVTTAALVAAIADDRERHRYRLLHRLVRADGLGDWPQALEEALIGTGSQHILPEAKDDRTELTQRCGPNTWQYDAVSALHAVLKRLRFDLPPLLAKVPAKQWFHAFAELRNRTRGHGATTPALCKAMCPDLELAIRTVIDNISLFKRSWAYLHRNLSGKYKVVRLTSDATAFDHLRGAAGTGAAHSHPLTDGIHIDFGGPTHVELIRTTVDIADYFLPNGMFNGKTFDLISYITDTRTEGDAAPYLLATGDLPESETEGLHALDTVGDCFTNLPTRLADYIDRPLLERALYDRLIDERHPVITLVGRGGIGKTSLALTVLEHIAHAAHFYLIVWFSARDIDLLSHGPKIVAPRVLSEVDIAREFALLYKPKEVAEKQVDALSFFGRVLTSSPLEKPILFVFDNFETIKNPNDLFAWLSTRIRLPNKILITTRQRDFKADFPIEVSGMTPEEASKLIDAQAIRLGIRQLLTEDYIDQVHNEADGHPYIIKVLLGEVAKAGKIVTLERLVATKDEMLDALFERTYASLSPAAKRVFLTLCRWRSLIPQLAVEAILMRPANEKMDVGEAIEELIRSSFVVPTDGSDSVRFISVPLVASVFGRRKLEVTPMKVAIEADVELLQVIGATQSTGIRHGIESRIERLFRHVAKAISSDSSKMAEFEGMLEFVCRRYPPSWLMLATLHEESAQVSAVSKSKEAVSRLLERADDLGLLEEGWQRLARLCQQTKDWAGEIHALLGLSKLKNIPFRTISNAASRLNDLLRIDSLSLDSDEKRIVAREFAELMERRSREADAVDLSRLAWLCLHLRDESRASRWVEAGLKMEPENFHLRKLASRLGML